MTYFVLMFEEGPELDEMIVAMGQAFESEEDITGLARLLCERFGVPLFPGRIPDLGAPVVRGLIAQEKQDAARRVVGWLERGREEADQTLAS